MKGLELLSTNSPKGFHKIGPPNVHHELWREQRLKRRFGTRFTGPVPAETMCHKWYYFMVTDVFLHTMKGIWKGQHSLLTWWVVFMLCMTTKHFEWDNTLQKKPSQVLHSTRSFWQRPHSKHIEKAIYVLQWKNLKLLFLKVPSQNHKVWNLDRHKLQVTAWIWTWKTRTRLLHLLN